MAHLKNIYVALLIILVMLTVGILVLEIHIMHDEQHIHNRLLAASADGMTRGILLGGLTGGLEGATLFAISMGVINPAMVLFSDKLIKLNSK